MAQQGTTELARNLKNRHVQLIALGGTIGTGLFLGSGQSIHSAGPSILLAYVIAGLACFLLMRALGEMLLSNLHYRSFIEAIRDYLGEKIGTKLGATLNATLDAKLHAKIVAEFEGFLGSTILTVLNVHDIKPVVEKIDKEEAAEIASPAANTPTLPDKAGFVDKVVFYTKAAGAWCAEKVVAGWQIIKEYCGLGYHKVVNLF